MDHIKTCIDRVRLADAAYFNSGRDRETEARLWVERVSARRALRSAVHQELGVTIDELTQLCVS